MLPGMNLITVADAATFDVPDTHVIAYAAPSRGARELCLWRIEIAAGSTSPLHHMDCKEVFLCVAGRAVAETSVGQPIVEAGDCLVLPAGTDFSFRVLGDEPFGALACIRAGGQATMADSGETFVPPWAK
jgi:mannose-6-phosphate isomerase-like protein (cupin superfamily)